MDTPQASPARAAADGLLRGEAVYIHAFDLAYDMRREPVPSLLGRPMEEYATGPVRRGPKNLLCYRPQTVHLPPERRETSRGPMEIRRSVKLFRVGALSIQVRLPFEVERLEDLVGYHHLDLGGGRVEQDARDLAERARRELAPYCVRPVETLGEGEAYTVFCLDALPAEAGGPPRQAEDWLLANRQRVAGLLAHEPDAQRLSVQATAGTTARYLSYYQNDLVVVDWDAALIAGERESLDDILHIMELANVQLVELAAYDRLLDAALEVSYRDVARRTIRAQRGVQRNLREIRVDLTRLSDELLNITKFFGDWHLAKIYGNLSSRFHLADWHRTVDEKLRTLADLYELLQHDRTNAWMVVLEATIVLLFIVDVVILLLGL